MSDGLVSHPGGVKDSHPLNTIEAGDEHWIRTSRLVKDLASFTAALQWFHKDHMFKSVENTIILSR